jgi:uncharacterized protein YodC (DUF2158 family)
MSDFAEGDTVRLKSGGPTMTVKDPDRRLANGNTVVVCNWFKDGEIKGHSFLPDQIEKVDASSDSPA